MFASPIDFLLNALVVAGLVVLAVSSFAMWRAAHRPGIGVVVVDRPSTAALFYAVQLGRRACWSPHWCWPTSGSCARMCRKRRSTSCGSRSGGSTRRASGDRRLDRAQCRGGRPGGPALSTGVVAVGVSVGPRAVARARDVACGCCRSSSFSASIAANDRAPQWPSRAGGRQRRDGGVADASIPIRRSPRLAGDASCCCRSWRSRCRRSSCIRRSSTPRSAPAGS